MRKKIPLFIALLTWSVVVLSQVRSFTGKITDEKGDPVPFASIKVKAGNAAVVADANGEFTIRVSPKTVLEISSLGFAPKEITAEGSSRQVQLAKSATTISEVVVTGAFGIKRSQRNTAFSSQVITSENLNITPQTNLADALSGKIAGVQFRSQSGAKLNSQTAARIRGGLALGGDLAPLYVVDGTVVNDVNITGLAFARSASSLSFGGAYDIDPDIVESVSVLKGANATALFGDRAKGGAIIITTKKAKAGTSSIEVSQGLTIDKVYRLARLQNRYAGGAVGQLTQYHYKTGDPVEWKALDGKYFHDFTDDSSWGPEMLGQEYAPWYSWVPGTKYTGTTSKLAAQPNNARDFFSTGLTNNTNVSFARSGQNYSTRISFTNQSVKGIIPGTNTLRNTVSSSTNFDINSIFSTGFNVNFTTQSIDGEFDDSYANQSTGNFTQWGHRDLDINILRELRGLKTPTGTLASWNWYHNPDGYSASNPNNFFTGNYWYNFYSYFDNKIAQTSRNRVYGNVFLSANLAPGLKLKATVRKDILNSNIENISSSLLQASASQTSRGLAAYVTGQFNHSETNYELLATYNKTFLRDFNLNLVGGGNIYQLSERFNGANTVNGLIIPDYYAINNSKAQPTVANYRGNQVVNSVFASGDIEFKRFLSASLSLRKDWSSTLPAGSNSLVYPSAGLSFIASEFTQQIAPWLSFAKVFGSWGKKPISLDIYQNNIPYTLNANQWNGNTLLTSPDVVPDPNLKGSLIVSYEAGLELRFLRNRLGLNLTYYNETAKNQPVQIAVDPVSGLTGKSINAATVARQGIEILLDAKIVSGKDFNWTITKTFGYLIKNPVTKIIDGQNSLLLASGSSGTRYARAFQVLDKDWGQLIGGGLTRNSSGQALVDPATGLYVTGDANYNWGSVVPKVTGGLQNLLTYKNFIFNASIGYQFGGRFFSLSESWGAFSGDLDYTATNNNKGKSVREAVANGGGVHVTGVSSADGKTPVDTYVDAATYFQQFYFGKIAEPYVHKLSYVKLRELSIGYVLPVKRLPLLKDWVKGTTVSLVARNPWLIYSDTKNYDPSEISGVQGEDGQLPSVRSFGFNVKFNF
jgi:TonB-linked SusC/RagA family outer membrane protein